MRTCTKCGSRKPLSEFFKDRSKKHGHCAQCKICQAVRQKEYRKLHPELNKVRYWKNRDSERERHLRKKYGIGFKEYREMLLKQSGACAICNRPEPKPRTLDVDHDHTTGIVRGLLCTSCNRMIGHAGDNSEILISASEYLRRSKK